MAKQKPVVRVRTYGIYSQWDSQSKSLPDFLESTLRVPAKVDVEFGLVVNLVGAKNMRMRYCIDHPGIRSKNGSIRAPFEGIVHVKSNDWDFFLGDTVWEPIEDKVGPWRMFLELDGKIVADQTFDVFAPASLDQKQVRYKWIRHPL